MALLRTGHQNLLEIATTTATSKIGPRLYGGALEKKNGMNLKNRFKEEDKIRYWIDHPYCAICRSNENCSLHHIDGCKQIYHSSILNSIMLCYKHHREADGHNTDSPQSVEFRRTLRQSTYDRLMHMDMRLTEKDKTYLASVDK